MAVRHRQGITGERSTSVGSGVPAPKFDRAPPLAFVRQGAGVLDADPALPALAFEAKEGDREMISRIARSARMGKIASLALALSLTGGVLMQEATAAADPQGVVRSFYGSLLGTMQNGRVLGQSGRYARLAPVVDRTFDLSLMARLAIGPSWTTLTPAQQQQLTEAFEHYVAATYADRFDSYSGEQLQVTGEQPYGAETIVQTKIVKSNGESTTLNYLMRQDQGGWRISDVYLDGTISQLAVQRSEFNSILKREGVDGLVLALNRKVDLLRSVARSS
jgi:phospholipid transport system substrate-binding protein